MGDDTIIEEIALAKRFRDEVVRLERIVAHDLCGMTSRPPSWRMSSRIQWIHDFPELPASRKFTCMGVARECIAWSNWLGEVLNIHRVVDGRRVPVSLREIAEVHRPPRPRDMSIIELWPVAEPKPRVQKAGGHHGRRSQRRRRRSR